MTTLRIDVPERAAGGRTGVFIGISSSDYSRRLLGLTGAASAPSPATCPAC